jgi:predicted Ser/Thr protein kinase
MMELSDLERFEVRRALGTGGVGVVYEAIDRESGATVAIKTLRDVTPEGLYRLKREFRLLQGLEHQNVCQHYELFEHAGRWFITMECVQGDDLLHHVRQSEDDAPPGTMRCDDGRLRDALAQLAEALCALHDAGLVHRDLKPSNVIVAPDGRVVLIDFGFVEDTAPETPPQRSQSIVGTPMYMAPEQALAADVGPAADWYSFGVILYAALTDALPHDGETALAIMLNKQKHDPPRASSLVTGVPEDLDALCAELLRADPATRPTGRSIVSRLGRRDAPRGSRPAMSLSASSTSLGGSFVGRDDELGKLRAFFDEPDRVRTMTILVEGPSGVGKTALVRQFTEELFTSGALVLGGRCYERESVPYKAFDSVVDALARHLRRLPEVDVAALLPRHPELLVRMFPVLGVVRAMNAPGVARVAISDPQEQRNRAFAALREVLHRLASRRPLVIWIDDWQWADADSVVLARDLIRHRDSPPMVLVLTARPSEDAETAARIEAVTTPELRRLRVESLAEDQAIELARQLRASFAPTLDIDLVAIARETHGHPLYISELIRYAATRGPGAGTAIRLEEVILARIQELPPEARAIVEALSVAGEPLPLDVLRDAVEQNPTVVERQSAVLRLAHLVRSGHPDGALEPYHDRVREAVLDAMPADQRLTWHRKLGFAIEASPLARARPELLLRHLEVAGEAARATGVAVAAAQRAAGAGAFDQAAGLFGLALRIGHLDDAQARALRIEMGQALANAGRGHESASAFLLAAEGADPAIRLDCHRQAAEQLLMIGNLERGLEILRTLLADVGVHMPMTQKRALVSVLWGRAKLRLRGLGWKERRATEIAPETLVRLDVLKAASHSLALVDNIRAADFNARWLMLALRVGERMRCAIALATETVYQGSQGSRGVVRARALLETVRGIAAESSDARLRAFLLMSEGTVEYWVCNLARADELMTRAEQVFREETTGTTLEFKSTRMFLAFTLRHRGAWARLAQIREEYVADGERCGDRYVVTSMNRYCSALWLAADDPAGARRLVDGASWVPPTSAFHNQHWYELEARGEIAIYDGTVAADLPVLEQLFAGLERSVLLRVTTVRALSLWLRGRLALRLGGTDGAKLVSQAIARLARVDNPRARVMGALLEAGRAGSLGDDATATARLRDAATLATEFHLALHASAARRQLGRMLGGSEGGALVATADDHLHAEGIVAPERFADWFVPGLVPGRG